jgi:hypothetical protein
MDVIIPKNLEIEQGKYTFCTYVICIRIHCTKDSVQPNTNLWSGIRIQVSPIFWTKKWVKLKRDPDLVEFGFEYLLLGGSVASQDLPRRDQRLPKHQLSLQEVLRRGCYLHHTVLEAVAACHGHQEINRSQPPICFLNKPCLKCPF